MPGETDTYLPWFILREIPGIGIRTFLNLIRVFETPGKVLAASVKHLTAVPGVSPKIAHDIRSHQEYRETAEKELSRILTSGYGILTLNDPAYPELLREIPDPPPLLTLAGRMKPSAPCLAVVGSRNATSYGLNTARYLAAGLAEKGFTIVSGMARGIDTAAHLGALDAGGKTIAVMGSGLKKIYPWENKELFHGISKHGVVVSEFKLDTDPYPYNFPVRNRVIAGLSVGTVVVEAEKRSGSLITARLALEYNREVFAVPGSIKSRKSQGAHALLKQGAKLVENETDVLDELGQFVHARPEAEPCEDDSPETPMDKDKKRIFQLLEPYPKHIDRIITDSRMTPGEVSAILMDLELDGRVRHHPGNYFSISEA